MARIRTIKPEFPTSPQVRALTRDARLFFLQLLNQLDDQGRAEYSPKALAGQLYPSDDDVESREINDWVTCCCESLDDEDGSSLLVRYEHRGRRYIAAPKFNEHQVINKPTKSRHPAPDDQHSSIKEGFLPTPSSTTTGTLPDDYGSHSRNGAGPEIGNRKEEIGKGSISPQTPLLPEPKNEAPTGRKPAAVFVPALLCPIPERLDCPEFREAWKAWLEFQAVDKRDVLSEKAGLEVLHRLATKIRDPVAALIYSRTQRYKGIVEEGQGRSKQPAKGLAERHKELTEG